MLSWFLMVSQAMESTTRAFYARSDLDLILVSPAPAEKIFAVRISTVALSMAMMALPLAAPFIDVLIARGRVREHIVEAHDGVGDPDGPDGGPEVAGGGHIRAPVPVVAGKLDAEIKEHEAGRESDERHLQHLHGHEGEEHAQRDRGRDAERHAEPALRVGKGTASERDHDRVVGGEDEIDPHHLRDRAENGGSRLIGRAGGSVERA